MAETLTGNCTLLLLEEKLDKMWICVIFYQKGNTTIKVGKELLRRKRLFLILRNNEVLYDDVL